MNRKFFIPFWIAAWIAAWIVLLSCTQSGKVNLARTAGSEKTVYRISIRGAITPATMEILENAIAKAEENHATALLVVLDTPGGLASSMDDMVQAILSSRVPVITYVGPPGATCGSAGVFLMYASQLTAMAPATNIGSATPVMMGPGGAPDGGEGKENGELPPKAGANDTVNLKRKQINHSIAQIRSLADYHGRNADFAERTITYAANITSTEALKIGAIDLMASSEAELLRKADGRQVRMVMGRERLDLKDARVVEIRNDLRSRILSILANPNVAYILMMVGILGILAEIQYPGSVFPGVVGAMSLLLGLYAMQTLPVNYAGLGLILLGILFLILEIKVISYGLLTVAGLASLIIGSLMLVRSGEQFGRISLEIILVTSLTIAVVVLFMVYKAADIMRRRPTTGYDPILSEKGETITVVDGNGGQIRIHSEIWSAKSAGPVIQPGKAVHVLGREGMGMVLLIEEESQGKAM